MEYSAEHDKNLAHYFANPARQRQLRRAKLLERIERTPAFYRHMVTLCRATSSAASEACLCTANFVCVLCMTKQRRTEMLSEGEVSAPLKILLEEIGHPPPPARSSSARPQSAASRPVSSATRHLYSASTTPRPPSTTIPSRPTSAFQAAPPKSASPDNESSPTNLAASTDDVKLEKAGRRTGRKSKASRTISTSRVVGPARHVYFDAVSPKRKSSLQPPAALVPAASSSAGEERPIGLQELTFGELLNGDPRCFMTVQDRGFTAIPVKSQATSPENAAMNSRVFIENISAKLKATAGHNETVRVELSSEPAAGMSRSAPPRTFLLIRFTAEQYAAAIRIQSAFRGHTTRVTMKHRIRAARIIQRRVRKYIESRRTAVAVWALERHGGRWCPAAKFTQIANNHTLTRPKMGVGTSRVPGEVGAIHAHEEEVVRLSSMISLMCSETKERVSLLTERYDLFTHIVSLWVVSNETSRRQALAAVESVEWAALRVRFNAEARFSSHRKTLLYKHESLRSTYLREHRNVLAAASCELGQVVEESDRCSLVRLESAQRVSLQKKILILVSSHNFSSCAQNETASRNAIAVQQAAETATVWSERALRLADSYGIQLLTLYESIRRDLLIQEIVDRAIASQC
jgi:hypothetical protein